ncbi:MAG: hypothetical protein WCR19_06310 [Acholeplasmataceae bacterium]
MSTLLKTLFSGSLLSVIVVKWDYIVELVNIQNAFQDDLSLLIKLGGMIGYTVFIIFAFLIQRSQIKNLTQLKKNKGYVINAIFILLTIIFLSYMLVDFKIQIAVINLMLYLVVVSLFDYISEKIIIGLKPQKSHTKTII